MGPSSNERDRKEICWIESRGGLVRAQVAGGSGPAVVIAADAPNVIDHYDGWIDDFSVAHPNHRVVVFEFPGFGASRARAGHEYSIPSMTEVARLVVEKTCDGPVVLAFPCAGGFVALELASRFPNLVSGLLMSQTPSPAAMRRWLDRVDRRRLLRTKVLGQSLMRLFAKRIARGWYEAALPREASRIPFVEPALRALDAGGQFRLASLIQGFRQLESHPFGEIDQPLVSLWGSADRTHRGTAADSITALAPHASCRTLDCGHFPDLERSEQWLETYAELRSRIESSDGLGESRS